MIKSLTTDSLAQKWDWTALPHVTTHILPTGEELSLFYLSDSSICGVDMDLYSRHISMSTVKGRSPINADSPRSVNPVTKSPLQSCSSARGARSQPSLPQVLIEKSPCDKDSHQFSSWTFSEPHLCPVTPCY